MILSINEKMVYTYTVKSTHANIYNLKQGKPANWHTCWALDFLGIE